MRESSITIEDVLTAGRAIQAAGRAVTAYSLRMQIGSGRSDRLFRLWTEHGLAQNGEAGGSILPARANDLIATHLKKTQAALSSVLLELCSVLEHDSRSVVLAELESLRGTVDQQQVALADAQILVSRLEQRNEELEELLEQSEQDRTELRACVDGLKATVEKDSSALLELTQKFDKAADATAAISAKFEDGQVALGKAEAENIALRERVEGLLQAGVQKESQLLDARRDAQGSREREAIVNGQLLQLQRDRDDDLLHITRLRVDLSASEAKAIQGQAEAEVYRAQLAALNERLGLIVPLNNSGGDDD
ncbi:hypothetical protein [Pseudomonas sp. Irchel 3E13]|uniref:hypothetical protein n=1 Tax=Pseudomonas sp. Irchel 3E13 TaxID=2008975 RepID=UPI000BA4D19C|nr:hypothetical protein [Pseudomonas sp. Irchel 3E13]